ncbi:MAG: DUF4184 domain-containing protein [Burkholderiales bacterium]|nr:DUF4184 domain-containing protein [Burkholderiales bacterium]
MTVDRFSHTLLGATLVGLVSVWPGHMVCELVLRWWNTKLSHAQARYLAVDPRIGWGAAMSGAALGVYSHAFLNSVMHMDVRAFAPFSAVNPIQGVISMEVLHLASALVGMTALAIFAVTFSHRRITSATVGERD